MPFMPLRPPVPGSIDQAAQRIYRMLEQIERAKEMRDRDRWRWARPRATRPWSEIPPSGNTDDSSATDDDANLPGGLLGALLTYDRNRTGRGSFQLAQAPARSTADAGPETPPFLIIPKRPLPIPEKMPSKERQYWHPFNHDLRNPVINPPLTEAEAAAFRTTFGLEGGTATDPLTGSRAGLTPIWLNRWVDREKLSEELRDPGKLKLDDMAKSYKAFADTELENAGGGKALAEIGDAKTATQIFDAVFNHGRSGGAEVIARGINAVIGSLTPEEQEQLDLSQIYIAPEETIFAFGKQSLDRVKKLVAAGYAKQLRAAIIDQRYAKDPPPDGLSGLHYRYQYHR